MLSILCLTDIRAEFSSGVNMPNSLHLADECELKFGWICWFVH